MNALTGFLYVFSTKLTVFTTDRDVSTDPYWEGICPIVEVKDAIALTYEALTAVVIVVAVVDCETIIEYLWSTRH